MVRVSSRRFKQLRTKFRQECETENHPCWLCSQPIDYDAAFDDYANDDRFELDHYYPVSTHPELEEDPANFRPSHAGCNNAKSNRTVTGTLAGTLSRDWTTKPE